MNENRIKEIQLYRNYLRCIDRNSTKISGSYDSTFGHIIYIKIIRKCKIEDKCTDYELSKEYFKAGWVFVITNEIKFDSNKYDEESIVKYADVKWIPVSTQSQLDIPFSVKRFDV